MKKVILILTVLMCGFNIHAQSIYRMYSNGSGAGEYIDNLRNAPLAPDDVWGIRFSAGSITRGFINNSGQWGLLKPSSAYQISPAMFNNILKTISNLTIGVEGWVCAEGFSVRALDPSNSNTLDLLTIGSKSTITSNGDSEGLHVRSAIGHKIYLYDKVYFDDKYWTSLGPGRNNDPTINNANNNKMMRIGSNGGLGFWGTAGVEANDNPQLAVKANEVSTTVPMSLLFDNHVNLFLGYAVNHDDGWIGTYSNHGLHLGTNNGSALFISADRNLYVDLSHDDVSKIRAELKNKYRLFVKKGILSEDYAIAPNSSWSDFVFSKDYSLPTIYEVADFIQDNNHLSDVPSAEQVAEEGYSQHDMNKILLQKIEELTLYTIRQQKEIDSLKAQLQESKK